jgi:RNA polymerase sigma factor (TIGR02999 family)
MSDALFEEVYSQLRRIARERLRAERRGHTLQATALVHEVWLRIGGEKQIAWGGRAQFFAAAVAAMRRILIDHARRKGALKRGRGRAVPIGNVLDLACDEKIADAVALDDLLLRLEKQDAPAAEVVRLRFYAGLSIEETAEVLGVSASTVKNNWAYARAWLAAAWKEEDHDDSRRPDAE